MPSPESSYNISTGEKIGYIARNFGVFISAIGFFVPALLVPGLSLAASGEILKKVSEKK